MLTRRRLVGLGVLAAVVGVAVQGGAALGVLEVTRPGMLRAALDGPQVAAAHRTVRDLTLPAAIDDDPTLSACPWWAPVVRCGWSDLGPEAAVAGLAGAVREAGLSVGPTSCGDELDGRYNRLDPDGASAPECGALVEVPGAELWLLATDRVAGSQVPLGATEAWIAWEPFASSPALADRMTPHWYPDGTGAPAIAEEELRAALPERYRDLPCTDEVAGPCAGVGGEVVTGDLADPDGTDRDELVRALVAELTDHGFATESVQLRDDGAHLTAARRFGPPPSRGLLLLVVVDGSTTAHAAVVQ